MKILVLSDRFPPYHVGGAEKSTFAVARGLVEAGCEVSVLTWVPEAGAAGTVEAGGMRVHRFHSSYDERFRAYVTVRHRPALRALARVLAAERPDVVQAHHVSNHLSYAALALADRAGVPVVLTAHDPGAVCHQKMICGVDLASGGTRLSYEARPGKCAPCMRLRWFPLRNALIRRAIERHASHRFANSRELARILELNGLGTWEPLYNPFLPELESADPEVLAAFRARFALEPGTVVLGSGGRLGFWKGIEHLVRAAGAFARRGAPPFRLVLAGAVGPEYAARLESIAAASGVAGALVLTGWIDGPDLAAFYAACDVVAVPSIIPEALPRLAIEAAAAGVPVVGSPFGGTPEVVLDGETGLVANPLDEEAFAAALGRLVAEPETRRRMGEAGRRLVAERFNVEGNVARRLEVYRGLVGR